MDVINSYRFFNKQIIQEQMNINDNPTSSATQCAQIKAWLEQGKKLTSLDALKMFGCMRLASRIHDLRERGMNIIVNKIQTPSGKYVAQYSLEG